MLCSCSQGSAPSAQENDELDNAAQMLDEAPNALSDIDENALAQSESNSTDPPR